MRPSRSIATLLLLLFSAAGALFAQPEARDLRLTGVDSWPSEQKRWALIIGIDQYVDSQISPLSGAENDANALAAALEEQAGFLPEQIQVMTSGKAPQWRPTRTNVLRQLAMLRRSVPEDGLLLISFAGHGIERGGRAFLLPADASMVDDVAFLEDTALSLDLLKERIRQIGVKQVVFLLDACRNDPSAGRSDSPNPLTEAYRDFRFDVANEEVEAFATVYATAVGQRAFEYTPQDGRQGEERGYFTSAVVEGLRGAAADQQGRVTLARLVEYVQTVVPQRVELERGRSQRPFAEISGYRADDLVLSKVEVAQPEPKPEMTDLDFWLQIEGDGGADDYIAYVERFPEGRYVEAAFYEAVKRIDEAPGAELAPRRDEFTYEEYLRRFPQGRYAEAAQWRLIESSNDPAEFRSFLARFGDSNFAGLAKARLEELLWRQAFEADTPSAYQAYVAEFPRGVYRAQAEDALARLEWSGVAQSGDATALLDFAGRLPDSPYAGLARQRAEQLEWSEVRETTDPDALRAFLVRHPEGSFADVAKLRIEELERPAPELPQASGSPGVLMAAGDMAVNPIDRLEYAYIPAGSFEMGCVEGDQDCKPEESPRHPVEITEGFWMSRTEVTVQAYRRYAREMKTDLPKDTNANPNWKFTDHPITRVTWDEAQGYCAWAGGRLPTEAEWEYAARGGFDGRVYAWEDVVDRDRANFKGKRANDRWEFTSPVRSFDPNPFGLFDMAGNVWEWTADWFGPYSADPAVNPTGPAKGDKRVLRGGSWHSSEDHLRVSMRDQSDSYGNIMGFRCVMNSFPEQ